MAHIRSLTLTQASQKPGSEDEISMLRRRLLEHLEEQKAHIEAELAGETYQPTRPAYVTDKETGERVLRQVPKRVRRWFWRDGNGNWFFEVRYGNRAISIDGQNTAIQVSTKDELPEVVSTLQNAVQAGELDDALKKARQARQRKPKR